MKKVIHFDYGGEPLCDMQRRRKRKKKAEVTNDDGKVTCKTCEYIVGKSAVGPSSYWDNY